ncbi:MAG: phosphoribosylformylglycinamidine cyclo-ligase [Desulfobacterales bacterium C00003060]|nr:MAG: phosphoribosylformylglycinamidine cyclo-ligase [Desulfobacterales bacterium S3730MH5]OEU80205.1 MAG: phosphoribosylformylglycinamidine cyclo-ligase [Desulfobacterales bacterium C00003060]
MNESLTYQDAGVDIDKAELFVETIKKITNEATPPSGVIAGIGGFSGLYSLDVSQYENPVLATSTDGVGTKIKVACMMDKHDTIGIDLVAMCVNDIAVQGAKPLFFLDYLSMGTLVPEIGEAIVRGIIEGCKHAGCALIGGETAEMPGMYGNGEYDLAGFVVGIVDNNRIVDGAEIAVGHKVVGIASSGLHSNGYSLARKICFDRLKLKANDTVDILGRTIGEELLEPTKIYSEVIFHVLRDFPIHGIAHITGGGIVDNLPRILPSSCMALIREKSWETPPVFTFLQEAGKISKREMMRTFNNGIGLILVLPEQATQEILDFLTAMDEKAYLIGSIVERQTADSQIAWAKD